MSIVKFVKILLEIQETTGLTLPGGRFGVTLGFYKKGLRGRLIVRCVRVTPN